MDPIFFDVFNLIGAFVRLLGMIVFGLGFSFFAIEVYRKSSAFWAVQMAAFLGLAGLAIAMAAFTSAAGLGGFAIGAGAGLLIKAPRERKEEPKAE
jgi:uncharacterized membrane protein YccC